MIDGSELKSLSGGQGLAGPSFPSICSKGSGPSGLADFNNVADFQVVAAPLHYVKPVGVKESSAPKVLASSPIQPGGASPAPKGGLTEPTPYSSVPDMVTVPETRKYVKMTGGSEPKSLSEGTKLAILQTASKASKSGLMEIDVFNAILDSAIT